MGKRKTKKQKQKTFSNRSLGNLGLKIQKKNRVVEYGYSQSLIKKDLVKTILISVLILGIELALYFVLSN